MFRKLNALVQLHFLYKFPRRSRKGHKYLVRMGRNDPYFEGNGHGFAISPIIFDLIFAVFLFIAAFILPGSLDVSYPINILSGLLAFIAGTLIIYRYVTFFPSIWNYIKSKAPVEGEIINLRLK